MPMLHHPKTLTVIFSSQALYGKLTGEVTCTLSIKEKDFLLAINA